MSFARILIEMAGRQGRSLPPETHPEPLATLDYLDELALKREALAAFWRAADLPGRPDPVLPAPQPRRYRTTTKRRVVPGPRGVTLAFPGAPATRQRLAPSALDLPEHVAIYEFLIEALSRPTARPLAAALSWAIVRGAAGRLALVLNVRRLDAPIVRSAKRLSEALQEAACAQAGFLYLDPSDSGYYLEARRPTGMVAFKRLFGPDWLPVEAQGMRLRFPVTVFSQVNGAMLETMITTALSLLGPLAGRTLLDLYCGYGLFSLTAGREAAHVTGVDTDGPAIEAARANAVHCGVANRTRFVAGRIDADFLAARLRRPAAPEVVLLDPPRQGTYPGVVAAVAARQPAHVVHICCGTEEIPREVAAWSAAGLAVQRVVPLDLFAGTANLETMLLLSRSERAAPS